VGAFGRHSSQSRRSSLLWFLVAAFCAFICIGLNQLSLAAGAKIQPKATPISSRILAPILNISFLVPPPPDLTVSLDGYIRNINPHASSLAGTNSILVQKMEPGDVSWSNAGYVPESVYFPDGRTYNFYQGPGGSSGVSGVYQYRASYLYYDAFYVAHYGPWAYSSVYWSSKAPISPGNDASPGTGCGDFDPKLGGTQPDCGNEGTDADPVNLATGFETYRPKADLSIYNPVGPAVMFQRTYSENANLERNYGSGLPLGWSHNYDVSVTYDAGLGGWSDVILHYPNGAMDKLEPNLYWGNPLGTFNRPAGLSYAVVGVPSSTTTGDWDSITIKWTDESTWTFTPTTTGRMRLTRITVKTGQYLDLTWSSDKLQTVENQNSTALLSLYYTGNNINESRDAYGRSVYYAYDVNGLLSDVSQVVATSTPTPPVKVSYAYGTSTSGSGDNLLDSLTVPSPAGGIATSTTTINYDNTSSKVQSVVDANGNSEVYTYSSGTTLVQNKDALGTTHLQYTQKYDSQLRDTGIIDDLSNATTIEYLDSSNPNKPTKITDRDSRITSIGYDNFGNMIAVINPRSLRVDFSYDYTNWPTGRLVQIQRASDPVTTITYFSNGLIDTITTAKPGAVSGNVSISYTYNSLGNILTKTVPGNNVGSTATSTFNYTNDGGYSQSAAIGQPLTITDANSNVTRFRYDSEGRVTSAWDAANELTSYSYNIVGQPTQITLPATGQTGVGNGYKVNAYLWPGGPVSSTTIYNESAVQVKQLTNTYGDEGELLFALGDGELSAYTYDALYRIKTSLDGNGSTSQYDYDSVGRISQISYPSTGVEQFTSYDGEGHLLQRIEPRGRVINYTYSDAEGKLTDINYPLTPADDVSLSYDSYGRVQSVTDGQGTYAYTYGRQDEVVTETTTYSGLSAVTLTKSYYPDGSRSGIATPVGNYSYDYDAGGRPTSMTNPFSETTAWQYTADSLSQQTYPNGTKATYSRNALGMLTSLQNLNSSNAVISALSSFTYNGLGNLLGNSLSVPGATSFSGNNAYTYNAKEELTAATSTRSAGFSHSFASDSAGNLTTLRGVSMTYNSRNQITGTGYTYDASGNPTTYAGNSLTFDTENRLQTASGYAAGYRSDNLRAWTDVSSSPTSARKFFYYCDGLPMFETSSAGVLIVSNTFGANGLISRTTATSSVTGLSGSTSSIFYMFDERGNTLQRVDGSQAVVTNHTTDAYGITTGGSATGDPYAGMGAKYGYYYEDALGMYCLQNRYYDPINARFLTRDPIGYSGGMNLYAYVGGNPIGRIDPAGTDWAPSDLGNWILRATASSSENIREFWTSRGGGWGIGVATVATTVNDFVGGAVGGFFTMGSAMGRYAGGDPCTSGWDAGLDALNIVLTGIGLRGIGGIPLRSIEGKAILRVASERKIPQEVISNSGRALSKHPELVDLTKADFNSIFRTDPARNLRAQQLVEEFVKKGKRTTGWTSKDSQPYLQYGIAGKGGVRVNARTGKFIGFIKL
jgi:RHS repeat-associated protein